MSGAEAMVSVVVPVYNSAGTLPDLGKRVASALAGRNYELVLVNDGSTDESWARIVEIAGGDARIRGVDLARNCGQHNALLAGIRAAHGQTIVTIDDDLQNPPEEIPKLLAKLDEGYDVVYGTTREPQHGMLRVLVTQITKWSLRVAIGSDIASQVSAFRAFRTDLRDVFADVRAPQVSIDVLLSWGTARFAAVSVRHDPRANGASSYSFAKLATYALNVLTGYTIRPLRIATLIGLTFTLAGVGVFVFVVVRYFVEGNPVPGFPFLASLIAVFSGAQLLTLGIIGEYLARVHLRVTDHPAYVIRAELDHRVRSVDDALQPASVLTGTGRPGRDDGI